MDAIRSLLHVAEVYRAAQGLELSTVSWRLFGDSKKLDALTRGSDIQVRRFETALRWLSDNWPANLDWPCNVARPQTDHSAPPGEVGGLKDFVQLGAENPGENVSRTNEPGSRVPA